MKILFVVEAASPHAARWINQLRSTDWDIHVFQAYYESQSVSGDLCCGSLYVPYPARPLAGVRLIQTVPTIRGVRRSRLLRDLIDMAHHRYLDSLIRELRPDVIHSLGMNVNWRNLCLPVLAAKRRLDKSFVSPWIYSSWGTDLSYYAALSGSHMKEVVRVLTACDYLIAECQRDVRLARELGFRGELAGCYPAFGGVRVIETRRYCQGGAVASRSLIYLKGRHLDDRVGRAMTALDAFQQSSAELSAYDIIVGQASPEIAAKAVELSVQDAMRIHVLPHLPYGLLLRLVGHCKASLSLTVNDGLPSTLVEAMALGAFPIYSDLESIREWIRDGLNGFLVPAEDSQALAAALKAMLKDDNLVESAAKINLGIVNQQLSEEVIKPKVVSMYSKIARGEPVL